MTAEEMPTALRSFYLEQSPPQVNRSLAYLHEQAAQSPRLADKIHIDDVLTYIAELTREVFELRMVVQAAGLVAEEDQ
jgi:hypothetical protein